jgi:hypothetical protein
MSEWCVQCMHAGAQLLQRAACRVGAAAGERVVAWSVQLVCAAAGGEIIKTARKAEARMRRHRR